MTSPPEAFRPVPGGGKPCLLAVGFFMEATGLARVTREILTGLTDLYDVHLIGIGYKGPRKRVRGVTVHPCNLRGGDVFGAYAARDFVERHRPAVVFLYNDLWILNKYPRVLGDTGGSRIVCYCPLDGGIFDDGLVAPLAAVDRLVVCTGFARREFRLSAARLAGEASVTSFPDVDVIPHSVDTSVFRPLAGGRRAARRLLFPGEPALDDAFIVLNANRPQPRKRIDLTIDGFARFARGKPPGVRLYLHQAISGPEERADVLRRAAALGIADRLILGPDGDRRATDEELNLVYNACDVGLNTAMGEGWGLVSFEHAATGAAQVVPRHSACAELWADAAEFLEPGDPCVPDFSLLEMRAVSPEGVAAALERLYADHERRGAISRAAYRNATRPAFRWENVAGRWRRLFAGLSGRGDAPAVRERTAPVGR